MNAPSAPSQAELEAKQKAVRELRRRRARRLTLRLVLFVILPTVLATVHYTLLASNQYESRSIFTVYSAEGHQSMALETLIGAVPGAPATRDTLAVREFILSRDMLARLDREHGFIAHYQDPSRDVASRLWQGASFEDAYWYFRRRVRVVYDTGSGVLTVTVRAYTPEAAQTFSKAILSYSEEMVNGIAERARDDQTKLAKREVGLAEKRLRKAREELTKLQHEGAELNPAQTASAALEIRTRLQGELAQARAELGQAKSYMSDTAPQVKALKARVAALGGQVASESSRMVNPTDGDRGLAKSIAKFEEAALEKEFATKAYESALASLELARVEASRQHRYLATIATPSYADSATHPLRAWNILTVFVVSFLLLGIGSLIVAAVKEHARI